MKQQTRDSAVKDIQFIAKKHGWVEIDHQDYIMMISFTKEGMRINIYYARPWRMTVATILNHPEWGRQQLFRKYIRLQELEQIFKWPRTHTGRGYYKKCKPKQRSGKISYTRDAPLAEVNSKVGKDGTLSCMNVKDPDVDF